MVDLARFPRVRLTLGPTPLHPLRNLSEALGGPELWIKRDDQTGLATGGNKTRKLEFLIGEALAQGASRVVTHGATQSNHVRQTIAAANLHRLRSTVLLETRVSGADSDYLENGNVLLDRILGAEIETRPAGLDMNAELRPLVERYAAAGQKAYAIPGGGSNPIGALGYVLAAQELIAQADDLGLVVDHVVVASGSAGTQAGLVVGLVGSQARVPALGVSVRQPRDVQEANVRALARATWERLELRGAFPDEAVVANADYVGPGYGVSTPQSLEAIRLLARHEGILLDPVYTAKGFAGLIDLVRKGVFRKGQNVVFLHTGGSAGLFAYRADLTRAEAK
jgi:L-cysteate sulfo-lyase